MNHCEGQLHVVKNLDPLLITSLVVKHHVCALNKKAESLSLMSSFLSRLCVVLALQLQFCVTL